MPAAPLYNLALPTVKTLEACSDFDLTVRPYLFQLRELPERLLAARSFADLGDAYKSTNPVISGADFSIVVAIIALVVSSVNKNYSQIDRVWSILPMLYNCHYWLWAYLQGIRSARLDITATFSLAWSARLTFNYWRKGGYQIGSEDYRWEIIKKYVNAYVWFAFNVIFISLTQSVLLWLVTTPTYIQLLASRISPGITAFDRVFPQLLGGLLVTELFADNQQWAYQGAKKAYQSSAKVPQGFTRAQLDRGFITSGLWQYSRHPNFAAEQGIWIALYQWSCFQTNSLINWTFSGTFMYILIFMGSTPITEWITGGKYPEYKEYKKRVGRFIPKLWGQGWGEYEAQLVKRAEASPAANGASSKATGGKRAKKNQ